MSTESTPEPELVESAEEQQQSKALGLLGDLELEFEKAEIELCEHRSGHQPTHADF